MKLKYLGNLLGLMSKPTLADGSLDKVTIVHTDSPTHILATATEFRSSAPETSDSGTTLSPTNQLDSQITTGPSSPFKSDVDAPAPTHPETSPMDPPPSTASVVDTDVSSSHEPTHDDQPSPTQDPAMDEKSGAISYQERQLVEGQTRLNEFLEQCEGAYGVIVSSIDGNAVVHQVSQEMPIERLANMTSSLLALGETIARESLQRLCRFVILENSNGRVVCLRINRVLMLTCIMGKQSNLGMALNLGQKTAEGLAHIF